MINKVILIGNVGADPEVRSLESGVKVARVRLATTERIYNSATKESHDHTEWHSVTLWRGLADVADRYVRKGSQIYIEGKIRSREWEDPTTQTKRYAIEILADDLKLLGRKSEGAPTGGSNSPTSYQGTSNPQGGYSSGSNTSTGYGTTAAGAGNTSHAATSLTEAPAAPLNEVDDLPF